MESLDSLLDQLRQLPIGQDEIEEALKVVSDRGDPELVAGCLGNSPLSLRDRENLGKALSEAGFPETHVQQVLAILNRQDEVALEFFENQRQQTLPE